MYDRNYGNQNGMQYDRSYQAQRPIKKRSGSKVKTDKNGRPCIIGWNKSKSRGFISFIASPHKKKSKTKSKKSDLWMVKMQTNLGVKWFVGFYCVDTKKLTIPDLQMVANPAKDYFGTYIKRK